VRERTISTPIRRHWHGLLLLGILLLGLILRFAQPSLVAFKRDEATIARLGQAIAHEGYRPAVGVDSSLGIDNLPLTLYLMALPLRLWSDPLSAVIFTILLNGLALPACYLLGRAFLGKRAALLATLLFAVSPWAVLYARKIWARTLPLVTIAFFASLWLAIVRKKWWAMIASFAALGSLLGLQLEALAFVPILGFVVIRYHDELSWKALSLGLLVLVVLLAPYILHEARHGWQNARGLIDYAQGDGSFSLDAIRYTLALLGSQGIEGQAGSLFRRFKDSLPPLWWINGLLSVLLLGGVLYGLHQAFRATTADRRRTFVLLLLWIAVPVVLQLQPSSPTQQHYFVMHYPAQYLLIAAFVVRLWDWLAPVSKRIRVRGIVPAVRGVTVAALVVACGWQVLVTRQLRATMVAHPSTGGYGIPLRYRRRAAQEVRRLASGGEIVVLSRETVPFVTETPTVFSALLFGVPCRFADGRVVLPLPERESVAYLVVPSLSSTSPGADALADRLERLPPMTPGPSVELPDGPAYRTYLWSGTDRAAMTCGMTPLDGGIPFANDVVFAAAEAPRSAQGGDTVEVWLAWWVRTAPAVGSYHFTVQLLDGEGRLRSQDDHAGFPSQGWHAGDLVLSRFVLGLPSQLAEGVYQLWAGMYRYPEIERVPVVDSQGRPIDDGVTLGKLRVVTE